MNRENYMVMITIHNSSDESQNHLLPLVKVHRFVVTQAFGAICAAATMYKGTPGPDSSMVHVYLF